MSGKVKVYWKPSCMTCKGIVEFLRMDGLDLEVADFFKDRLSKEELRSLLDKAGLKPKEALRRRDPMHKKISLKDIGDEELLKLMEENPGLIIRPILVKGDKVAFTVSIEEARRFIKGFQPS